MTRAGNRSTTTDASIKAHRFCVLVLHAICLACFGVAALRSTFVWPSSSEAPPASVALRIPLLVHLQFAAETFDAAELVPQALRMAIAAELSAELKRRALLAACPHAWRVRQFATLQSTSTANTSGLKVDLAPRADGVSQPELQATIVLRRGRGAPNCQGPLTASRSAHVAYCAFNATAEGGGIISALASLVHEHYSGRACELARNTQMLQPPARISLLLLHRQESPCPSDEALSCAAHVRRSRFSRLDKLRAAVEALVELAWPFGTPSVYAETLVIDHDDLVSRGVLDGALHEAPAVELIEACATGGARCGSGFAPSIALEPPLRLLFYANAPLEAPLHAVDGRGRALPAGAGFVLPARGALLPWVDDASDTSCAGGEPGGALRLKAGLIAQLRVLMGLRGTPSPGLSPAATVRGLQMLEVAALQLACVQANLEQAESDLQQLHFWIEDSTYSFDSDAVYGYVNEALMQARGASRSAGRDQMGRACAQAVEARLFAREAVRHPSLLTVEELPENYWLSVWPPLFFPIATAVVAEARHWMMESRQVPRARSRSGAR